MKEAAAQKAAEAKAAAAKKAAEEKAAAKAKADAEKAAAKKKAAEEKVAAKEKAAKEKAAKEKKVAAAPKATKKTSTAKTSVAKKTPPKVLKKVSPEPAPSTDDAYILQPGDEIELQIYREPEISGTFRLNPAGELLAAPAHHQILVTQHSTQAMRHLDKHRVAGGMAVAVVDRLEVVEIQQV